MSRILKPEGLRGEAMTEVSCEMMLLLGRAAAIAIGKTCSHPPVFYICRDPRRGTDVLEAALCAGICSGGGIAQTLGVLPSAGLSLMLSAEDGEAGFSISGGDMLYDSVSVRLYAKSGALMSAEQLDSISALMQNSSALPVKTGRECGFVLPQPDAPKRYLRLLGMRLKMPGLREKTPLRIALDCANGAVSGIAESLFKLLGSEVLVLNDNPDGININQDCGVKSPDQLISFVRDYNCAAGFAFDGDGARCLAVDEQGETLRGDRMLAVLCEEIYQQQQSRPSDLPRTIQRGVAVTVMANLGFLRYAKSRGIPVQVTQPAEQFLSEKMRSLSLMLGGDSTGKLYFSDSPAPDGLIAAARIFQTMQRSGKSLSELAGVMEHDPQVAVSVRIPQYWREIWKNDPEISGYIAQCEQELGMEGRILVRERRDDASLRILLEGRDFKRINDYAFAIAEKIQQRTRG